MTKPEPTGDTEAGVLAVDFDRRHTALVAAHDRIVASALAGETVTRRWARWEERRDRLQVDMAATRCGHVGGLCGSVTRRPARG
ncbi:MAG: hypothetical protein OJJ54_17840 [Pseudonocardia sp.]|nr:hypothetical protein [Pseudonocardia sp.]